MRRSVARWLALALLLVAPAPGRGAEITDVATAFDADNPFDFRLRVGYQFSTKTAAIKREHEGNASQTQIDVLKDLVYSQKRHQMGLRLEAGIYQDLMFSVEMPLILSDSRSYSYDQRKGSECVYPGQGASADVDCVNSTNSLTTNPDAPQDTPSEQLSNYYIVPAGGFDALNGGSPFASGSDLVFRGVKRGGSGTDMLDTINFGLTWAALSQRRDRTKPTWIVSAEYRVSIGNIMRFDRDPMRINANHGVADGLDHFVARTAVSHRFRHVDPYAAFWFDYPIVRRDDTLFFDLGPTAKNQYPQMSAGTIFGLEFIPWERPEMEWKIAFDVNGQISGKFDGRGYSEIWELLAASPALACDPSWNLACDPKSTTNAYQGKPYTGITTIENYAILAAQVALNVQAAKHVRFRAYFNYEHDQSHFLTTDDVGKPDLDGSRVSKPNEFNPAFRPIINEIGRRYKIDDVDVFTIGLWGQMMF